MTVLPLPDLFEVVGKTLFGDGPMWKAQLAHALGIRADSVDRMCKGKSRISPGLWRDIAKLIDRRMSDAGLLLPRMKDHVIEAEQLRFVKREASDSGQQ